MRSAFRLVVGVVAVALTLAVLPSAAGAQATADQSNRMEKLFTSPNHATESDFAFWGDHAFAGYYTGDLGSPVNTGPRGGFRIFDVSDPASPKLIRNFRCDGLQNDPFVWDTDDNGVADLMLLAVDRTMERPHCGADRSMTTNAAGQPVAFHADPNGWEGVRVFTMSDNPKRPFRSIEQVAAVYNDCGAHTITGWTGNAHEKNGELIVYVSSYPLNPGPTCGVGPASGPTSPPIPAHQNVTNPYDGDKVVNDPLHRQIQVVRVPLDNPEDSEEIAAPEIVYPGDPDDPDDPYDGGVMDWQEKGLAATLEDAAVACHDIVTHMEHNIAGAACAEQGQVWEIDPATGIPDTENPMLVGDDEVSSGGGGPGIDFVIPGAIDFFHSVMFDNQGDVVNWVDESFGTGCPTTTTYQPRPWNPAGGTHKTGSMAFSSMEGEFLSLFNVGDVRPNTNAGEYCSAHMGMTITGIEEDILVNAWYTGGVDVIDFTDPTNLREIAYYDPWENSGTWSAYPYTGPLFKRGRGVPVYASDGVTNNALGDGMVVYRAQVEQPRRRNLVPHLNPQTMDHEMVMRGGGNDDDDDDRGKGRGRDDDD
jgi:hypothetical protein